MIELSRGAALTVSEVSLRDATPDRTQQSAKLIQSTSFQQLMRMKLRLIAPLLGVSVIFITALALLSGYGRPLMSMKVSGAFNVGYLMVLGTYLLCWVVSVIYVNVANRTFETYAARVSSEEALGGNS